MQHLPIARKQIVWLSLRLLRISFLHDIRCSFIGVSKTRVTGQGWGSRVKGEGRGSRVKGEGRGLRVKGQGQSKKWGTRVKSQKWGSRVKSRPNPIAKGLRRGVGLLVYPFACSISPRVWKGNNWPPARSNDKKMRYTKKLLGVYLIVNFRIH